MKRIFPTGIAFLWVFCGIVSADVLVLQTGKTLRIHSYRVEGTNLEVEINDHSDMVIPVEWVREIRDEPDPPPVPQSAAPSQASDPDSNLSVAFADHVRATSEKYEVDPRLIAAVMKVESNFNPHAVSKKGARGLMQLMPDTARLYRVRNPYDPKQNIEAGVKYLKRLMGRYNNKLELVLAAYNSGEKTVDRYRGIPPFAETKQYVQKVLQLYRASM